MTEEHKKHSEHSEHKEEHKEAHHKGKIKKIVVWQWLTIILAVLFIASIFTGGFKGATAQKTSAKAAAEKGVDYINANLLQQGMTATLKGVSEKNGLYVIKIDIAGREYDSYVTVDGALLFPSSFDMNKKVEAPTATTTQEIQKTDKPEVELHVFSYCPAGTSALDSFAPVAKILQEKADFKVRFFSNMHGEHELQQNKIQECIQNVDYNKYWDYASDFFEEVYTICGSSGDIKCDKEKSTALMNKKGIDSAKVLKCVEEKGDGLYTSDKQRAAELQLSYSPSFVINDVFLPNIQRTPEGIKSAVCSAFNQAPEECTGVLASNTQVSAGGSC